MKKVFELEEYFEAKLSKSLSCEWDNDGLMLCANSNAEVKKAFLTLDITDTAVKKAIELGTDAIFTHHPFIFHPLSSLTDKNGRNKLIFKLLKNNISVFSYHTRLDKAEGGVNDILSALAGLKNIKALGEGEMSLGRIGDIEPCSAHAFALVLKNITRAELLMLAEAEGAKRIERVAVLGGACDRDIVNVAIEKGADLLLTGDCSYNLLLDANLEGLSVICLGHYASENPVLSYFEAELNSLGIETFKFNSGYFKYL